MGGAWEGPNEGFFQQEGRDWDAAGTASGWVRVKGTTHLPNDTLLF